MVSADSLFHFTLSLNNIKNILSKKFHLTYCKETIKFIDKTESFYFPMISFCDLPLSLAKEHINKYGCYGIGMSKKWGIEQRLNPVTYIESNSVLANDFINFISLGHDTFQVFHKESLKKVIDENTELKSFLNSIKNKSYKAYNFIRYVKNYKSDLNRKGKQTKNYKFYDEREWRYVPPARNDLNIELQMTEEEYKKYRGTSKQKPLIENFFLDFTANDVEYLIVKSGKDIPDLIRYIKSTEKLYSNSDEADILTTKILTVEQLKKDI